VTFLPTFLSLVFLLTAVANGFLAAAIFRRKKLPGNNYFALFAVAFAIWAFCVFLEFGVQEVQWKVFFSKCSYFGVTTAVVFQFLFALRFAGLETGESIRKWYVLFSVSVVFIVLGFTNDYHYLQWVAYETRATPYGTFVKYVPGAGVWVLAFFMWGLFLSGMVLISKRLMVGHALYEKRFFTLMVVFLFPLAGNMLYMFKLLPYPEIDWSPQLFFVAFASLYAMMRKNQMLEILPESRETTFKATRQPVLVANGDGLLVDVNPAGLALWPELGSALSRPIAEVMPEVSKADFDLQQELEIEIERHGNKRWYELEISPVFSESGEVRGRLYLLNDITEAHVSRRKLAESEQQLRELNASKDRFFSIIGHDLRTPFSVISGLSVHLMEDWDSADRESNKQRLSLMVQSSNRALELLENLLTWAQLQSDGMKAEKRVVNVARLITNVTGLMEGAAARKQISIENSVEQGCVGFIDENMIATVLRNLLSNALKFSHKGGMVSVRASCTKERLLMEVEDQGTGIPPELKEKLFKVAEKTMRKGTAGETGTGLGLLLCKEFVERHNGTIEVESSKKGTLFRISLPNEW
jgi:signal transduction histidine kinase